MSIDKQPSTWNCYISPLTGLPMYVRRDVDQNSSKVVREMTAHYYGRIKYRINVYPKPHTVWYDSKGHHYGGAPIREYMSPEKLQAMWGDA